MAEEPGDDNGNGGWRFERTLNAGHVLTTAAILVAALSGYFDLRGRVDNHDRQFGEIDKKREADLLRDREQFSELKDAVKGLIDEARRADRTITGQVSRLDERMSGLVDTVRRIETDIREQRRAGAAPAQPGRSTETPVFRQN